MLLTNQQSMEDTCSSKRANGGQLTSCQNYILSGIITFDKFKFQCGRRKLLSQYGRFWVGSVLA
jgi:hypothetical protein